MAPRYHKEASFCHMLLLPWFLPHHSITVTPLAHHRLETLSLRPEQIFLASSFFFSQMFVTVLESLTNVCVYCNKVQLIWWLNPIDIYTLMVLEASS